MEALSPVSGWPTACATVSCEYCRAVLSFQGLPAVRYADHLTNEHRILFHQDDVIRRSLQQQLPGLLPADTEPACNCRKPFVRMERRPGLMLQFSEQSQQVKLEPKVELLAAATQTELTMAEVARLVQLGEEKLATLEVAVQTVEGEVGRRLESEVERRLDTVQSAERMGQLLESAAQGRTGQEYPCTLCARRFSNLYGVKIHILECHEDYVGQQHGDSKVIVKKEGVFKGKKRPGMKFKRHKKITHPKKPWCNYCWIKFKSVKEHKEHKLICPHQQAVSLPQAPGIPVDSCESFPCKSPVKIETKVDEGNEITDLHRTEPDGLPKATLALGKLSKLNMVKAKPEDGQTTLFEAEEAKEEQPDMPVDAVDPMEADDLIEAVETMEAEEPTELQPKEPTEPPPSGCSEPDWRERDRERVAACPVPIRPVTVLMPERAETVLQIDPAGTYHLTELDRLGLTVAQFAADPVACASVTDSPILSKLLDKGIHPDPLKQCSLCAVPTADLLAHITDYHQLTSDSYLKVFPGDAARLAPAAPMETEQPILNPILIKSENLLPGLPPSAGVVGPVASGRRASPGRSWQGRPWYESVKTTCRICRKSFWHGQFVKHVKYEHSTPLKQYREMFPSEPTDTGQYQCLVCRSFVAHYSSPISGHLTSKHGMTITEYYEIYERFREKNEKGEMMVRRAGEKGAKQRAVDAGPGEPIKCEPDVRSIVRAVLAAGPRQEPPDAPTHQSVIEEEKKFRCKICSQLVSLTKDSITQHMQRVHGALQDRVAGPACPPPPEPAAPWYNRCTWTCLLCSRTFCSGFWKHVNEKHFLKKEDYLRDYGKQGIRIVHYHCRICEKKVPWSGASINAHTKATHCLSLQEYETIYGPAPLAASEEEPGPSQVQVPDPVAEQHQVANVNAEHKMNQISVVHQQEPVQTEKWFNGCEYTCQICFRALHSVAGLSKHLKDTHGMEKLDYFKKFGRDGIKVRKYCCKICGKDFPWSGVSISKHLTQGHQMTLQEYTRLYEPGRTFKHASVSRMAPPQFVVKHSTVDRLATGDGFESIARLGMPGTKKCDRWYNKCTWNCQLCGRHFKTNASSMFKHVTQDHKVSVEEYKERFGNTGTVFVDHKCRLCFKKIPCNGLAMCKHFKHSHHLTLEEYERLYMLGDDGSADSQSYVPSHDHWYNKCVWKCQICGKDNKSQGSSKKHVAQMHKITYEEYFELFGNQGITEVSWSCAVCQMVVSCNGVSIASHLNGLHKMTLQEYEAAYLKDGEVVGMEEEPVVVDPSHCEEGDTSTIQSLHIGLDIEDGVVSGDDDISIIENDPLTNAPVSRAETASFDPLADIEIESVVSMADIEIESVVSIKDPDFPMPDGAEMEANQETNILTSIEDQQGAVVIHDVELLEDSKEDILKSPKLNF